MRSSALSTHVGIAFGNEFQIGVRIENRLRGQLHLREPIHTRIHLVVRDEKASAPTKARKAQEVHFIACPLTLTQKLKAVRSSRRLSRQSFALNEPVLSALGGDLFKFFAVNRGALEPIITPHTVPNEMNSVVIGELVPVV